MNQTLHIPDELYRSLMRYASARHETVEEALATLLRTVLAEQSTWSGTPIEGKPAAVETETVPRPEGPWEGLFGAFESPYPDLVQRHDYYIGDEALDTHEGVIKDTTDAQS